MSLGPKMTFTDNVLALSKEAQEQRYVAVAGINVFASRSFSLQSVVRTGSLVFFQVPQLPRYSLHQCPRRAMRSKIEVRHSFS